MFHLEREVDDLATTTTPSSIREGRARASEYNLRIRLAPLEQGPARLEIEFVGVRNLRVGDMHGLLVLQLDVQSIRGDQLEGLAFKVQEQECRTFSFVCSDFSWKLLAGT